MPHTSLSLLNQQYDIPSFPPPIRPSQPSNSRLSSTPGDLLFEISRWLSSRTDILNLCLTSNHIYQNVASILYSDVVLHSVGQCRATLFMLNRRSDIARHVRQLTIKLPSDSRNSLRDSDVASFALKQLAMAKRLDALVRFTWDVDETPMNDDMWFALRMGCPQLRYISTNIGARLPSPSSYVRASFMTIHNLRGFALTLKPGFYERHIDIFFDEENFTSLRLWEMLINRCPNLEELAFKGTSTLPVDVHTLIQGHWPRLRQLSLGDVSVDWVPGHVSLSQKRPFIDFLERHPRIEDLSFSRHTIQAAHLTSLNHTIHQLTSFSGTLQQLQAIPHAFSTLKSVSIRESILTREISALAVAGILQGMTALEELKVSFMLQSTYDSGNLLRSLTSACPRLRHLDLTCGHKPSFQLVSHLIVTTHLCILIIRSFVLHCRKETFSKSIRSLAKLRSLCLTIVRYPGDETLAAGAARIARCNPQLDKFSVTFFPPTYPLALPFRLPALPLPLPAFASGRYVLACDHHGHPLSLSAFEHCRLEWPWGLGVSSSTKKYVSDLRPPGASGRRKSGVKGLVGLLTERSSAGEEMRIILFCVLMMFLAAWGFVGRNSSHAHNHHIRLPPPQVELVQPQQISVPSTTV